MGSEIGAYASIDGPNYSWHVLIRHPNLRIPRDVMKTLVLLSGLLCDDTIWLDVADRLRAHATIRIIDFPGFDSLSAMASSVLNAVPGSFILVGHSMGGRVALEVVRQAPDRVLALGLFNTGIHARRDHETESRGRLVRLAQEEGMAALAAAWLPPMMGASAGRIADLLPTLERMVCRSTPEDFAAQTKALLERPDAAAVLPSIRVPTLLLSGTADGWSPVSQHEEMQRKISGSTLVAIEEAGHMAPLEQPQAVSAAMQAWMTLL